MRRQARNTLAALAFCGALASVPQFAAAAPNCTSDADYLVVEVPHKDDAGNSYIVRDKAAHPKAACSTKAAKGDYVIGGADDAFYLLKLVGSTLLIDSGTGPDRELRIYDLRARTLVYSGGYDSDTIAIDATGASFWTPSGAQATAANCPDLAQIETNGLTPVIDVKARFDFAANTLEKGAETHCRATQ